VRSSTAKEVEIGLPHRVQRHDVATFLLEPSNAWRRSGRQQPNYPGIVEVAGNDAERSNGQVVVQLMIGLRAGYRWASRSG
jgi:hypothetical protein